MRERPKERHSQPILHLEPLDRAYPILATHVFESRDCSRCLLPCLVDLPMQRIHIAQCPLILTKRNVNVFIALENCIFLDDRRVQLQNFVRFSLRDCFSELSFWRCMSSGPRLFRDFLIVLSPLSSLFYFLSTPCRSELSRFLFSEVLQSLAAVLCGNLGLHLHHVDSSLRNFIIAHWVITAGSKKCQQTTTVEHRPRGTGNDDGNRSCARLDFS